LEENRLISYIQEYRSKYARQAINKELLRMGYSRKQVDQAWQIVEAIPFEQVPNNLNSPYAPPETKQARQQRIRKIAGIAIAYVAVGAFILFLVALFGDKNNQAVWTTAVYIIPPISIVAVLYFIRKDNRTISSGLLYGMLLLDIVLPFIGLIILAGICLSGGYDPRATATPIPIK
jgi:hypothetical protein